MNLINYNQVLEALDRERQLLLNREQYGAENVIVHHAINVIAELSIIRQPEIVRCKDCKHHFDGEHTDKCCEVLMEKAKWQIEIVTDDDWFCADGEKK